MLLLLLFLVEVVIIVIVVIKPRLNCCLGREVLLLRRWGYRVIASIVEKERERGGKLEPMQRRKGRYLMSVVLGTGLRDLSDICSRRTWIVKVFFSMGWV